MASRSLSFLLFGEDVTASKAFAKVGASAEASGAKIQSGFGRSSVAAIGGLALGIGLAVKMAGDFQQQTNVLVTAAGETTANLSKVRAGILSIAESTGTSWQSVTAGMYLLEKAGYRGADALTVEKAAAQGAREENANLATVTQAMTSIMASYHIGVAGSVGVMNELKTAAGESKTTMEEFAGSLSTVLPLASANKISFADVGGSLATLTQHGTSASEATQELANTIRGLSAPNAVAVKEMAQLGISSVDVAQKIGDGPGGRGLAGTLNYLSQTVLQKMGPSGTVLLNTFNQSKTAAHDAQVMFDALAPATQKVAKEFGDGTLNSKQWAAAVKTLTPDQANLARQFAVTDNNAKGFQQSLRQGLSQNQTYTDAIKKMTGGANGLNTTLQLTGESAAGTSTRIAAIAAAAKGAGTNVDGWASTQKLFNVQLGQFEQSASAAGIEVGTVLLPALSGAMGFISGHTGLVIGFVGGLIALKVAVGLVNLGMDAFELGGMAVARMAPLLSGALTLITDSALGPLGLAIGAATVLLGVMTHGFGLFGDGAKKQIAPVDSLTQSITEDGNAVGKLTEAQVNNTLQSKGAYDAGLKLGISQRTVLQATLGNTAAQKQVAAAVKSATDAYNGATKGNANLASGTRFSTTQTHDATQAQKDAKAAADKLAGSTGLLTGQIAASAHAANNEKVALEGIPKNVATRVSMSVLGGAAVHDAINSIPSNVNVWVNFALGNNVGQLVHDAVNNIGGVSGVGHNAGGTDYWRGGLTSVNEQGNEIIDLPAGSKVHTASASKGMGGGSGMPTVNVHVYGSVTSEGDLTRKIMDGIARVQRRNTGGSTIYGKAGR